MKQSKKKRTSESKRPEEAYLQLHISLMGSSPLIWRRIIVPESIYLNQLHKIIQKVMGWSDDHLYEFEIKNRCFASVKYDRDEIEIDKFVSLETFRFGKGARFLYIFDYGDNWEHSIKVERILENSPSPDSGFVCLKGEYANPPEDIGGIWAYYDALEVLKDPDHPEYEDVSDWFEADFDPDFFDIDAVNKALTTYWKRSRPKNTSKRWVKTESKSSKNRRKKKRVDPVMEQFKMLPDTDTIEPESVMRQLERYIRSSTLKEDYSDLSDDEKAQELLYQAASTKDKKTAKRLVEQALDLSKDCADAYCWLAENDSDSIEETLHWYMEGVKAGERFIGADNFEELKGHFWLAIETRPYMRAMGGVAESLKMMGNLEHAVQYYEQMLLLNPNDNQGIRDRLITDYMILNRDDEAQELYKKYEEDISASWKYSKVLLDFRKKGKSIETLKSLEEANDTNKHIPYYLLDLGKLPEEIPYAYSIGSTEEATIYVVSNFLAWKSTEGALDWLSATLNIKKIPIETIIETIIQSESPENSNESSIPIPVQKKVTSEVKNYNKKYLKKKNCKYVARFENDYCYLDRIDYGKYGEICRLKYDPEDDSWDFAIFKWSSEQYDPDECFFPGAELVDGTVSGAMAAGMKAYPI